MKTKFYVMIGVSAIFLYVGFFANGYCKEKKSITFDSDLEKMSYVIGLNFGTSLKRQSIDVVIEILLRGINDGLEGNKPLMSQGQIKETIETFRKNRQQAQKESKKKACGKKQKGWYSVFKYEQR